MRQGESESYLHLHKGRVAPFGEQFLRTKKGRVGRTSESKGQGNFSTVAAFWQHRARLKLNTVNCHLFQLLKLLLGYSPIHNTYSHRSQNSLTFILQIYVILIYVPACYAEKSNLGVIVKVFLIFLNIHKTNLMAME